MVTGAPGAGLDGRDVRARLLIAVALSAALHFSLIYAIAPRPAVRSISAVPIAARIFADPASSLPVNVFTPPAARVPVRHIASNAATTASTSGPEPRVVAPAPIAETAVMERREDSTLPKADLPMALDQQWYEARDLDTYPRALTPIVPAAQESRAQGSVTLLLSIDETGSVHDVRVIDAQPTEALGEAAVAAAKATRFEPGRRDGHAVRSKLVVKLRLAGQ